MRRIPATLLVIALAALASFPALAATPGASLAALLEEGDRYWVRGQFRTALKLYQAAGKSFSGGLPGLTRYRLAVTQLFLDDGAQAVGELAAVLAEGPLGVDLRLAALYRSWGLVRLERWSEATEQLRGAIPNLDRQAPEWQVGSLLARSLAEAGELRQAVLVLDGIHRRAAPALRERVAAELGALPGIEAGLLVGLVQDRALEPQGSVLIPWLGKLVEGGRTGEARKALAAIIAATGSQGELGDLTALRSRLDSLGGRAPVRVGVLLPLSGSYAYFGQRVLQAFQLAVDLTGDLDVELLARDTRGDPEAGREAARELIVNEKVSALLGPVLSSVAEQVIKAADEGRVPVLSPASQAPGLPARSPWFFRNCLTLPTQARAIARAAVEGFGLRDVAVLSPGDNYGKTLSSAFWDELTALGGRVVVSAQYGLEETDFGKAIQSLRGREVSAQGVGDDEYRPPFEAVFVPDTANRVGLLAPQLSFHDIERQEVILLGSSGLNAPDLARLGEEYVEGALFLDGFFAGRATPVVQDFSARYRARTGDLPDVLAAQAFDAAGMLLAVVRAGHVTPEAIRQGLAAIVDYPGVCGPTTMGPDRDVVRPPVLLTVARGRIVELAPPRRAGAAPLSP